MIDFLPRFIHSDEQMWQLYEDYCCKGSGKCKVSRVCDSLWCTCRCPQSKGSIQDDRGALVWPWCCLQMCSSKFLVPNSYVRQHHVPWPSWNKAPAQVANPEAIETWCWDSPTNYTKGSLMVYSWMPVHVCKKIKTIKMPLKRDLYPEFLYCTCQPWVWTQKCGAFNHAERVYFGSHWPEFQGCDEGSAANNKDSCSTAQGSKVAERRKWLSQAWPYSCWSCCQKFNATAVASATTIPPTTPPSTTKDNDNNDKHDDFDINDYIW